MTTTYNPARWHGAQPFKIVSTDELIRSLDPGFVPAPEPAPRQWSDDLGLTRWIAEGATRAVTTRQTYPSRGWWPRPHWPPQTPGRQAA